MSKFSPSMYCQIPLRFVHVLIGRGGPLLFTVFTVARLRSGCLRLFGDQDKWSRPLLGGNHRQRGGRDLLGESYWTKVRETISEDKLYKIISYE